MLLIGDGGDAVEHEAGSCEGAVGEVVSAEESCGIVGVSMGSEGGGAGVEGTEGVVEAGDLLVCEGGIFVGGGEVGGDSGNFQGGEVEEIGQELVEVFRQEADASHAGIDFQVHVERFGV